MNIPFLSKKRVKAAARIVGNGSEYGWNDEAGATKTLNLNGYLVPLPVPVLGASNDCPQQGATMAFYNNSATTAFVKFTDNAAAPATPVAGTGLPVPPNAYVYFTVPVAATGVEVSAVTVLMFVVQDSTTLG